MWRSRSTCSPGKSSAGGPGCRRKPTWCWTPSTAACRIAPTVIGQVSTSWSIIPMPGAQYTSFRFTQHLFDAGIDASIGTVGDALDNALAESTIGLYKTELIKPNGPWHNIGEVDVATAAWVDWYNNRRLHGACGGRPPTEFEALYELGDLISLVA